jgi:hypothetical protein
VVPLALLGAEPHRPALIAGLLLYAVATGVLDR